MKTLLNSTRCVSLAVCSLLLLNGCQKKTSQDPAPQARAITVKALSARMARLGGQVQIKINGPQRHVTLMDRALTTGDNRLAITETVYVYSTDDSLQIVMHMLNVQPTNTIRPAVGESIELTFPDNVGPASTSYYLTKEQLASDGNSVLPQWRKWVQVDPHFSYTKSIAIKDLL